MRTSTIQKQMNRDLESILQFMYLGNNSKSLINIKKKTLEEFFNIYGESGICEFFKYIRDRDEREIRYHYMKEFDKKETVGKKKKEPKK